MPFLNQMELVMVDIPVEIANQFIVNGKMVETKDEVLAYCDTIQQMAEHYLKKSAPVPTETHSNSPSETMEMEVFEFNESTSESTSQYRGGRRGSNRGVKKASVRRRPYPLRSIAEDNESDENYSFLEQMDDTSRSSFSEG